MKLLIVVILNYVIGSIHHHHNIQCVIVCQSSLHNVFCVPYLLDQTLQLLFNFCLSILCSFYLRVATIQVWRLFCSAYLFADIEESEVA